MLGGPINTTGRFLGYHSHVLHTVIKYIVHFSNTEILHFKPPNALDNTIIHHLDVHHISRPVKCLLLVIVLCAVRSPVTTRTLVLQTLLGVQHVIEKKRFFESKKI